jgi:hypothetical protein
MEDGHRENLEHLQALADDDDFHAGDAPRFPNIVTMSGVLAGSERIELSHAGGEFSSLEQGIEDDWVDVEESEGTKPRSFPHYIPSAWGLADVIPGSTRRTGGHAVTALTCGTVLS